MKARAEGASPYREPVSQRNREGARVGQSAVTLRSHVSADRPGCRALGGHLRLAHPSAPTRSREVPETFPQLVFDARECVYGALRSHGDEVWNQDG